MSRRKAIMEYRKKFPYYCNFVREGGMGGYGTHLETIGGRLLSHLTDRIISHDEKSKTLDGISKYLEFSKSIPYAFLNGLLALPSFIDILIETPIRKLTGKTKF